MSVRVTCIRVGGRDAEARVTESLGFGGCDTYTHTHTHKHTHAHTPHTQTNEHALNPFFQSFVFLQAFRSRLVFRCKEDHTVRVRGARVRDVRVRDVRVHGVSAQP